MFFAASAAAGTRVNVSPREAEALRVLDPITVAFLDLTGSRNETTAHLRADGRLMLMFCAFEGPPTIMRLYGRGRVSSRGNADYKRLLAARIRRRGAAQGARQIVVLDVDLVQTSCGFGVPLFDFRDGRPTLTRWAEAKGEVGLDAYRREKNRRSIDGLPTGLFEEDEPVR